MAQSLDQQFQQNLDQSTREEVQERQRCEDMMKRTNWVKVDYIVKSTGKHHLDDEYRAYILDDGSGFYEITSRGYHTGKCEFRGGFKGKVIRLNEEMVESHEKDNDRELKYVFLMKIEGNELVRYRQLKVCSYRDPASQKAMCPMLRSILNSRNGSGGISRQVFYFNQSQ